MLDVMSEEVIKRVPLLKRQSRKTAQQNVHESPLKNDEEERRAVLASKTATYRHLQPIQSYDGNQPCWAL
jgi:hypothetical protein